MKSEIIEEQPETYPCLKEYKNNSNMGKFIVLFTSRNTGTVVHSDNPRRSIGDYNTNWTCEFDKTNKKIILSND